MASVFKGLNVKIDAVFRLDWRLYYENTSGKYILYRYLLCFEYEVIISRNVGAAIWNIDDENLCAIIYAGLLIERVKE